MREALSGKLLDGGMQRVHSRSIADGVFQDMAAGMRSTAKALEAARQLIFGTVTVRLGYVWS